MSLTNVPPGGVESFEDVVNLIDYSTLSHRLDDYETYRAIDELNRYTGMLSRIDEDSLDKFQLYTYEKMCAAVHPLLVKKSWELIESRPPSMNKYGVDYINEWIDLIADRTAMRTIETKWLDGHTKFLLNQYIMEIEIRKLRVRLGFSRTARTKDRELAEHLVGGIWSDEDCLQLRDHLNISRLEAIRLTIRPPFDCTDEIYIIIHPKYKDADIDTIRARAREVLG